MTFKEAIDQKDFEHALTMINNGEDILQSQCQFKLSDAFPNIIRNNAFDVLEALIEKEHIELDLFEYDRFQSSIFLELAKEGQKPEVVEFLENNISNFENLDESLEDKTWISIAIENGASVEFIECLSNNDCEINYRNKADANFLHTVLSTPNIVLKTDLKKEYLQFFIDQDLDLNALDIAGNSPLHLAINKSPECVAFLVEQGADPNIPNKKGETAYFMTLVNQQNSDLFQEMNALMPLDFDIETGKKTSLLFDYLQSIFGDLDEDKKAIIQVFADNGFDILTPETSPYGDETTVLDFILTKDADWLKTFSELFSLDLNIADNLGNTPLHKVCAVGLNFDESKAKDLYRKVKFLLKQGADPLLSNTQDKKPIDLAIDDNLKEKTVALLLKH